MARSDESREFVSFKVTAKVVSCYRGADSDEIQKEIGEQVGHSLSHILRSEEVRAMFDELSVLWEKYGVGKLSVLKWDPLTFTVTESGDLTRDGRICKFNEGLFAALIQDRLGRPCDVREVECEWKGEKVCRFAVSLR